MAGATECADGPVGDLYAFRLAAVVAPPDGPRLARVAVKRLSTVPVPAAESATDTAFANLAPIAACADVGLAIDCTDMDGPDTPAESAASLWCFVAASAERTVLANGGDMTRCPAADTFPFVSRSTTGTQSRSVLVPDGRTSVPTALDALLNDEGIYVVATAADRPFLAVGDDVAVLLATSAREAPVAVDTPVAAPASQGVPAERAVGAAADCAAELVDGLSVSGGIQLPQQPDQHERAARDAIS